MSFYEKFYEDPQYKKIRFLLDYQPKEYEEMRELVESDRADERADQLVDYLNFLSSWLRCGNVGRFRWATFRCCLSTT